VEYFKWFGSMINYAKCKSDITWLIVMAKAKSKKEEGSFHQQIGCKI
jgi:hypothetical protein